MRLSDIKGERTLDVIAEIIEPITNIATDDIAAAMFKREKLPEGETAKGFLLNRAKKSLPQLLKNHKADIISILASVEGTSAAEYSKKLNLVKLTKDFVDLMTDEAFTELFTSAQSGDSSGSVQENTEDTTA